MADARPSRTPRALRTAGVVALAAALAAAVVWKIVDGERTRRAAQVRAAADQFGIDLTDVPAPPIELGAMDGGRLSLAAFRGQVVLVNFWATWCPPCRTEMSSLVRLGQELAQRYPGKFAMVAVSVDDAWQDVGAFFGGPPPAGLHIALDTGQMVTRAYYCAARRGCPDSYKFPESYIVDPSGRLVAFIVGPRDYTEPAARVFLESLIGS